MASISAQRTGPTLHKPEPRKPTKNVTERVYRIEERTQRASEEYVRQSRHVKSSSLQYNSDGPSMRRTSYLRARSTETPSRNANMVSGGSAAALQAAKLSANAHVVQEHRSVVPAKTPSTVRVSPYFAAASKAWSNSTTKVQQERTGEHRANLLPPPAQRSDLQPMAQPVPRDAGSPPRKSLEVTKPALQSEFMLPMPSGGRSKSQNSDMMVQEVNQYVHAEQIHNGPLQAARISFAHDREMHQAETRPPSRPGSTNPGLLHNVERHNKSAVSLPWTERHTSPPPARRSVDTSRAALSAASLTWASHEHDNPRSVTPAAEPYNYITHKPQATLRKVHKQELSKFWKHGRVQPMASSDRKRYDGLWAANKGVLFGAQSSYKDDVANLVARDIWERSRLPREILSDIYDLVDRERRGCLSRDEFVVGTWLVDHALRGRKLPLPVDLTDDVFDGGYMARLGLKVPKKLRHDEKKYRLPGSKKKKK